METKSWWRSKTIWAGVVAVILAGYGTAATQFGLPPVPEWIFALLGALGVYGRTTANTTVK
jgi:hypothetical protein